MNSYRANYFMFQRGADLFAERMRLHGYLPSVIFTVDSPDPTRPWEVRWENAL